jgi:hypothetical protein
LKNAVIEKLLTRLDADDASADPSRSPWRARQPAGLFD